VVLDDRRVHHLGNGKLSGSFTIKGHQIQSIALGYDHEVMVTTRGAMFGFGRNDTHQLGVVDPSAPSGDTVSMPTEVFTAVTKSEGAAEIQRRYPTT
jgi:alpha-tubulin suppressor-like RCC1 family protein